MTTFDDRERGFETKYAYDEELEFKAVARRNRQLGLWAGEKLGLTGEALADYAKSVVRSDLREPGDEDVVRKVMADFAEKKVELPATELRTRMDRLLAEARAALHDGR